MSKILVIAAHPDDEVLGCGGVIKQATAAGHSVHVLHLTTVTTARGFPECKGAAIRAASVILGFATASFSYSDSRLDAMPLLNLTQSIESIIESLAPDTVYTHHISDLNQDHRAVAHASLIATRPLPGSSIKDVYMYPVLSSSEQSFGVIQPVFRPNVFVDIKDSMNAKVAAMECYKSELRNYPHPRSKLAIINEARHYGAMVGLEAAEAFELVRSVRSC